LPVSILFLCFALSSSSSSSSNEMERRGRPPRHLVSRGMAFCTLPLQDITHRPLLPAMLLPAEPRLDEDPHAVQSITDSEVAEKQQCHEERRRRRATFQRAMSRIRRSGQRDAIPSDKNVLRELADSLGKASVHCAVDSEGTKAETQATTSTGNNITNSTPSGLGTMPTRGPQSPSPTKTAEKRFSSYDDIFRQSLAGTELADRRRRPPIVTPRGRRRQVLWCRRQVLWCTAGAYGSERDVAILPEDPVDAYFKREQSVMETRSHESGSQSPMEKAANRTPNGTVRLPSSRMASKMTIDPESPPTPIIQVENTPPAAQKKVSPLKREVCQLLRYFVFGEPAPPSVASASAASSTNSWPRPASPWNSVPMSSTTLDNRKLARDRAMYEPCGTKEQIKQLHVTLDRLDADNSGSIDLHELRRLADRSIVQDWHSAQAGPVASFVASASSEENTRLAARMCERLTLALVGRRTTALTVEDFIRFLWPFAGLQEFQTMTTWYDEFVSSTARWCVPAPEVCPPSTLRELKAVFHYFDKDGHGRVSFDELVNQGLLHREMAKAGSEVDLVTFFTLACPAGFRLDPTAETGTTHDGERVVLDHRLGCWRLENVDGIPGFPREAFAAV